MNNEGPYRITAIRNGILTGHTTTLDSSNLIVENIMINDVRNGSEYRCVVIPAQGMATFADIIDKSDPIILYVAGEYQHNNYTYINRFCTIDTSYVINYCTNHNDLILLEKLLFVAWKLKCL